MRKNNIKYGDSSNVSLKPSHRPVSSEASARLIPFNLLGGGNGVAEKYSGGTTAMRYFVLDHLGSVAVIMDDAGTVLERLSYDAWGQRRCANGTGGASCFTGSSTTRGFTNQEEIDAVGLVNLNARIYDPVLGRFMSADPTVEAPYIPQDFNRYTYTGNNPLSFTDPSGLCFLGCFWKSPVFAAILSIAVAILVPYALGYTFSSLAAGEAGALGAFALGGALAGGLQAGLTGGNILQGMLLGGLQAAAFAALAPGLGSEINAALDTAKAAPFIGRMIASGLVGGVFSAAGGGNFGSGFLAAGVGSLGGGLGGGHFDFGKMLASAALGGIASVLGGGKFANGAITAAFAYAATAKYGEVHSNKSWFYTGLSVDPRLIPAQYEEVPGMDYAYKDAMENWDVLSSTAGNGEIVGALGRQAIVQGDFLALLNNNVPYYAPESITNLHVGAIYTFSNGVTFIDRNDDTFMDMATRKNSSTSVTEVNYGANKVFDLGWQKYDYNNMLPAPPYPGTANGPPGSGY